MNDSLREELSRAIREAIDNVSFKHAFISEEDWCEALSEALYSELEGAEMSLQKLEEEEE